MNIYVADITDIDGIAPLIAKFRVELKGYKGITYDENIEAAKAEFMEYISANFPIFIFKDEDQYLGYLVCRVDAPTVWAESIYVLEEHRRRGIASALFGEAERLAASYGEETLYNYVHPNNDGMIAFLNKKGYNVLNLIEIRKKYAGELTRERISVRNGEFNY